MSILSRIDRPILTVINSYSDERSLPYYYFIKKHIHTDITKNIFHETKIDMSKYKTLLDDFNPPLQQLKTNSEEKNRNNIVDFRGVPELKRQQIQHLLSLSIKLGASQHTQQLVERLSNNTCGPCDPTDKSLDSQSVQESEQESVQKSVQDLCCGKSYLGITLAKLLKRELVGIDINPNLINQLEEQAEKRALHQPVSGQVQDLLKQKIDFPSGSLSVALHACGELTDKIIIDFASSPKTKKSLLVVPCCYHKYRKGDIIKWFSKPYQQLNLTVNKVFLQHLTNQVKGSQARQLKMIRQCHQKRLLKITTNLVLERLKQLKVLETSKFLSYYSDGYVSVPDVCYQKEFKEEENINLERLICCIFKHPFFNIEIRWQQLVDLSQTIVKAEEILNDITRCERSLLEPLKRLVELMILEDRKLHLEENGYHAQLIPFTNQSVTPRNIAIIAY